MNAEKIYRMTTEAIADYVQMNREEIPADWERYVSAWEQTDYHKPLIALYRLNKEAMEEMYTKSNKGSSKPSLSAIKRFMKGVPDHQDSLKKAWWVDDLWVICDSYRLVGLKEAVPTIPTYDEQKDNYRPPMMEQIMRPLFDGTYMEEVEIPQKGEIKACILEHKARHEKRMKMKVGVRYLNPQYLLDMIEILPSAKMYQMDDNAIHMVFFKDEDGNVGLLLPINPSCVR